MHTALAISKNQIKYFSSLNLKKYRSHYGSFLIEGKKMALEILNSSSFSWNLFLPAILVGSADSITAINGISQEQWFAERAKSK